MSGTERRQANRVPFPETCQWRLSSSQESKDNATARINDLSAGGLAMVTGVPINPGARLTLEFGTEGDNPKVMYATVQHCEQSRPGEYLIGASFLVD